MTSAQPQSPPAPTRAPRRRAINPLQVHAAQTQPCSPSICRHVRTLRNFASSKLPMFPSLRPHLNILAHAPPPSHSPSHRCATPHQLLNARQERRAALFSLLSLSGAMAACPHAHARAASGAGSPSYQPSFVCSSTRLFCHVGAHRWTLDQSGWRRDARPHLLAPISSGGRTRGSTPPAGDSIPNPSQRHRTIVLSCNCDVDGMDVQRPGIRRESMCLSTSRRLTVARIYSPASMRCRTVTVRHCQARSYARPFHACSRSGSQRNRNQGRPLYVCTSTCTHSADHARKLEAGATGMFVASYVYVSPPTLRTCTYRTCSCRSFNALARASILPALLDCDLRPMASTISARPLCVSAKAPVICSPTRHAPLLAVPVSIAPAPNS